jgi:DNA-3-methyladenine glycosylase II
MSMMATPEYWALACAELAEADPVMAALIARYPGVVLATRGDPFQTLARAIVGQQISVKAADSVWARFVAFTGAIRPESIVMLELEALAACGLSRRKSEYLRDLAGHFVDGRIQPARWEHMTDEDVIAELGDVRGIGRWTAETAAPRSTTSRRSRSAGLRRTRRGAHWPPE